MGEEGTRAIWKAALSWYQLGFAHVLGVSRVATEAFLALLQQASSASLQVVGKRERRAEGVPSRRPWPGSLCPNQYTDAYFLSWDILAGLMASLSFITFKFHPLQQVASFLLSLSLQIPDRERERSRERKNMNGVLTLSSPVMTSVSSQTGNLLSFS